MILLLAACAARIPEPTSPWLPLPAPPATRAPARPPGADPTASPTAAPGSGAPEPAAPGSGASEPAAPGLGAPEPAAPDPAATDLGAAAAFPASALRTPPPLLEVCRVEFATGRLPGALVVARGALKHDVVSTQSGLLLVHPGGTWLVDGGMSADFAAHLREIPGLFGVIARASSKDWTRLALPADALRAAGYEASDLTGTIVTHGHYDHLGGLLDLADVPLYAPEAELAAARAAVAGEASPVLRSEAAGLLARGRPIRFDGPAVGPWPRSWDIYGDGSALVVPMPGHTPGSLGVLLRVGDRRAFLVGDTVWVREGYEAREPRGALATGFDDDPAANALQIQLLWQLHRNEPDVVILPAHDRRSWDTFFADGACRVPSAP